MIEEPGEEEIKDFEKLVVKTDNNDVSHNSRVFSKLWLLDKSADPCSIIFDNIVSI